MKKVFSIEVNFPTHTNGIQNSFGKPNKLFQKKVKFSQYKKGKIKPFFQNIVKITRFNARVFKILQFLHTFFSKQAFNTLFSLTFKKMKKNGQMSKSFYSGK